MDPSISWWIWTPVREGYATLAEVRRDWSFLDAVMFFEVLKVTADAEAERAKAEEAAMKKGNKR